jgi:predicted  nucleic acid-binding Zn-ribbon protein
MSKQRLAKVEKDLAQVKEVLQNLSAQYQTEKGRVDKLRRCRKQIEETKQAIDEFTRYATHTFLLVHRNIRRY